MSISSTTPTVFQNQTLAALHPNQYERLRPYLEKVNLVRGKIIYDLGDPIRYAYFVLDGVVSLLSITENGSTTEVGMVSNEGLVGIPAMLNVSKSPYRVKVQIPGKALRVKVEVLKSEFERDGLLRGLILRYLYSLITQISQSAACNRFHTLEERLCRWLLISHDHVKSGALHLTQEELSHMLGASRTNVTATAVALQRAKIVGYHRGRINILDRQRLEASACECYRIVTRELNYLKAA